MKTFTEYVEFREAFDAWKYFQHISQQIPNADDLKSLASMMAKQYPDTLNRMMSDMFPTIKKMIANLPPEEQEDVQSHFVHLKHQDPEHDVNMFKSGWRNFTSIKEFEDFVVSEMERENPRIPLLMNVVKANQHFWQEVDLSFKQYFLQWLKEQEAKQPKAINFGDIMKTAH